MGVVQPGLAAEVLIVDAKSQPESLTMAPVGVLIVGSASSPYIYKVRLGSQVAEKFIDASIRARSSSECARTLRCNLPGENSTRNNFAVEPDKALYITDTANRKIYKLPAVAATAEPYLEHRTLMGVDGITFLDGVMDVNNVVFNKLYRIQVDADGKPQAPVDIWMDQPVKGPDGMRAANGRLIVAENGSRKITALTVNGDRASVAVLKEGLKTPTGVEPAGDTL